MTQKVLIQLIENNLASYIQSVLQCIHGANKCVVIHTHTHTELHEMKACALISFSLCTLVFSIPYILFQPLGNDI